MQVSMPVVLALEIFIQPRNNVFYTISMAFKLTQTLKNAIIYKILLLQ